MNAIQTLTALRTLAVGFTPLEIAAVTYGDTANPFCMDSVSPSRLGYLEGKAAEIERMGLLKWTGMLDTANVERLIEWASAALCGFEGGK